MKSPTRRPLRHPRRGFALLLVVACLLLVTVAAVGVSRRSLLLALESADAADRLQARWGQITLQRSALQAAVALYGAEPPVLGPPSAEQEAGDEDEAAQTPAPAPAPAARRPTWAPAYRFPITLGQQNYEVILADESAKANLNRAIRLKSPEAAQTLAAALGGRLMSRLTLHKSHVARQPQEKQTIIRSWGEVLPIGPAAGGRIDIRQIPESTDRLTLWGDGKVNLLRAPDEVLFGLSRLIVSDGESRDWIREFQDAYPEKPPELVFQELGFEASERALLENLVALQSTSLSVWVLEQSPAATHTLTLAGRTGASAWQTRTFRYTH